MAHTVYTWNNNRCCLKAKQMCINNTYKQCVHMLLTFSAVQQIFITAPRKSLYINCGTDKQHSSNIHINQVSFPNIPQTGTPDVSVCPFSPPSFQAFPAFTLNQLQEAVCLTGFTQEWVISCTVKCLIAKQQMILVD